MQTTRFNSQLYDPQTVAETYQLGTLHKEFSLNTLLTLKWFALTAIIFWPFMSLFLYIMMYHKLPDPTLFHGETYILWFAVNGLVIIGLCVTCVSLYRRRNRRIYAHEQGLIAVRNRDIEAIRWDEIGSVWYKVIRGTHRSYIDSHLSMLQRRDGSQFQLGGFPHFQELRDIIEQETTHQLLPEALIAYQQGQQLAFGPFTLDQSGLSYGRKFLPWNELSSLQFSHGSLSIGKQGSFFAWAKVDFGTIPNLRVFQQLAAKILDRSPEELWPPEKHVFDISVKLESRARMSRPS
ncbi:MAG: hypothetical protein J2P36_27600 [Ktedonobacteraceae bacterium]|nr:hypothetical protein [Ktedonobacteraceae bacterium]